MKGDVLCECGQPFSKHSGDGGACYEGACLEFKEDSAKIVDNLLQKYNRRANDTQVGGKHYVKYKGFQPWDACWLWNLNFFQGVIIKYVVRYRDKNRVEDLKKAMHYLEKLIELEEEASRHSTNGGDAKTSK